MEITDYDRRKFESISGLIGLSIDNTSEQHTLLNIRLGMFNKIQDLNKLSRDHTKQGESIS